jgi:hypothetical protein
VACAEMRTTATSEGGFWDMIATFRCDQTKSLTLIMRQSMSAMQNVPGPDLNHLDSQKLELSRGRGGADWCLRVQITTYYFGYWQMHERAD